MNKDLVTPDRPLSPILRVNLDLPDGRSHQKDSAEGNVYQRLKFASSHSAILAFIQLFELWKSLTAFPGPTSSSRRARS